MSWDIGILIISLLLLLILFYWIIVFIYKPQATSSKPQNTIFVYGYNIKFNQIGIGPHLLLIHGIGASSYVWRLLTPLLQQHFTVTTFDLLGFGESDKPKNFSYDLESQCKVILEFLNLLNIKKTSVVGSSMGGAIALRLAQLDNRLIDKVIAISPAADPKIAFIDLKKLSFLSPVLHPLITDQFVKQIMKRILTNKSLITPESIKTYSAPYKDPNAITAFTKSFALLRDSSTYNQLKEIKHPVLLLWGKKDVIVPLKFGQNISKNLKNCELHVHPTAGHHPQEDEPLWVFENIQSFCSKK